MRPVGGATIWGVRPGTLVNLRLGASPEIVWVWASASATVTSVGSGAC